MARYVLIYLLFLISACANAGDEDYLFHMSNSLDFKLEWTNYGEDKLLSFEYCPTNRCDLFVSSKPNMHEFIKFIDLYILYASHYGDLGKISDKGVPPIGYISDRIGKVYANDMVSNDCSNKLDTKALSCTLNAYVSKLEIGKFKVTYDEGERVVVEDSVWRDKELSKENIVLTSEWLGKFGVNHKLEVENR